MTRNPENMPHANKHTRRRKSLLRRVSDTDDQGAGETVFGKVDTQPYDQVFQTEPPEWVEHRYRGDFYVPKVGSAFSPEEWAERYPKLGLYKNSPGEWFHFGVLSNAVDDTEMRDRFVLCNDVGDTVFTGKVGGPKSRQRWRRRLETFRGRPIVVFIDPTDATCFDIHHDPMRISATRFGTLKDTMYLRRQEHISSALDKEFDWENIRAKIGVGRLYSLIDDFDTNSPDEWLELLGEELATFNEAYTRPAVVKREVANRKRNRSRHRVKSSVETKLVTADSVEMKEVSTSKGTYYYLAVTSVEGEVYEVGEADRASLVDKIGSRFDGLTRPVMMLVRIGKRYVDAFLYNDEMSQVLDHQLNVMVSKRNDLVRGLEKAQISLDQSKVETQNSFAKIREKQSAKEKQAKDELAVATGELNLMERKIKGLRNAQRQAQKKLELIDHETEKQISEKQQLTAALEKELQKTMEAAMDGMEEINAGVAITTDIIIATDERRERQKLVDAVAEVSASDDTSPELDAVVRETPAENLSEAEAATEAGDNELAILRAELAQAKAEKRVSDLEARFAKYQLQQRDWMSMSEADKEKLADQIRDMGHEEWSEDDYRDFNERANTLRIKLQDSMNEPLIANMATAHSNQQLALRGGVEHTGRKIQIEIREHLDGSANKYRVYLPEHTIDIIACLDESRNVKGQLAIITFIHLTGKKFEAYEKEVAPENNKMLAKQSIKKCLEQHQEIMDRMTMAG